LCEQEFNKDIDNHDSDLQDVLNCGANLRKHATDKDASKLDSSLSEVAQRYRALSELGKTRLTQMEEVPAILERFYDTHASVLNWMQQIEAEINQCEVKPGLEAELRLQVGLNNQ